ncbi:MAG: 30S ribosomal protein S17 [bacterium]|nr:30S ribosomal protein S17 [bacterium]
MEKNEETKKKVEILLTGEVVSAKADKTISVNVERMFQHPVYKKIVRKKKKYLVHDEQNKCRPGDVVRIRLVRPISKHKRWLLVDVISTAPVKEVSQ